MADRLASGEVAGPEFPSRHRWPASVTYGRVSLQPFRYADIAEWDTVRAANRSWLSPWEATTPAGIDPPGYGYWTMVRNFNREARAWRVVPWLVTYVPDGGGRPVVAGQCTVSGIQLGAARFASIGYWVDQQWAGRGIIPTAVALATDYCFRTMQLHRIEIAIRPENTASLRVVEKLGFRYEGRKPAYLNIAGKWRDHECFALHSDEVGPGLWHRLTPPTQPGKVETTAPHEVVRPAAPAHEN
ncbi:MAG TPA: GNAT family protein [Propionibacteriaceae bacterium]|nr:GNAT family protein [Propionibacteriaceae bacterium]